MTAAATFAVQILGVDAVSKKLFQVDNRKPVAESTGEVAPQQVVTYFRWRASEYRL